VTLDLHSTFEEAVEYLLKKNVMPTDMTTAELRRYSQAFREQSFYSARTVFEDVLGVYKSDVDLLLNPKQIKDAARITETNPEGLTEISTDLSSIKYRVRELLREHRYTQPEGERGRITDLSSDARIKLIVETNRDLAWGNGMKRQGNTDVRIENYPGWMLFRLYEKKIPRDWPERFQLAGEKCGEPDGWIVNGGGGMFALKNHPIWKELGSSANFDDALDVDYPPFAFNSGMRVEEVSRADCESQGIIAPDEYPPAKTESEFKVSNN